MKQMRMKHAWALWLCMLPLLSASAETRQRVLIHAHNDYQQSVPFYQAYAQQVYSIEVDLFYRSSDSTLVVAHDPEEVDAAESFQEMYLEPIAQQYARHDGHLWQEAGKQAQLVLDLKSSYQQVLPELVALLKRYPMLFDQSVNSGAMQVVVSGSMPTPSEFDNYPSFIHFDGRLQESYTAQQLERIAMMSDAFRRYTRWNGKGGLLPKDKKLLVDAIALAHNQGKPIRFWGTPEGVTSWNTLHRLGVDIINTDRLEACNAFFSSFDKKNYRIASDVVESDKEVVDRVTKLDKTTVSFEGFKKSAQHLEEAIPVYTPTYASDGKRKRPKNVILLIGDGMGIAQLTMAEFVNGALTTLSMQHTALVGTEANDYYTADSAGAGSSIATGKKNNNRHISMSESGESYQTLADAMKQMGKACGVVTMGNLADATPAAFYAHTAERDENDVILSCLLDNPVDLLVGSGKGTIDRHPGGEEFKQELNRVYQVSESIREIEKADRPLICVDESLGKSATATTLSLFADVAKSSFQYLGDRRKKGFFVMLEAAKIDYAGHANSVPAAVLETLALDLAVAEALKFADQDGETLVIVTSDHETGGLTLLDGDYQNREITAAYMTDDHTPIKVPLFAYGPGADHFMGVYENTDIYKRLAELLKFR